MLLHKFVAVANKVLNKCDTFDGHQKYSFLEDFTRSDDYSEGKCFSR